MVAWNKQDLAFQRQISPCFIPFVIDFEPGVFLKTIAHRVESGFGYLLRYVTMAWYNISTAEGIEILGDPLVEFFVNRIACQTAPIEPPHITSPAAYAANDCIGTFSDKHLSALQLGNHKFLNYFYPFGSTVEIHVSRGSNILDAGIEPVAYRVHLVLKGYVVPEPRSRVW